MIERERRVVAPGGQRGGGQPPTHPTDQAVYHVNGDRRGRVDPHGEEITGREILSRAGLSADKYELWTVVAGKTGAEVKPDECHPVKPGDHFRATIRGTDYSSPGRRRSWGAHL